MDNLHNQFRFHTLNEDSKRSFFEKYQDLVIGQRKISALLKYELITLLFGHVPGALGLALRYLFYPLLFQYVGEKVFFGHHITLRSPHRIHIGNNVAIEDYAMLAIQGIGDEKITIGDSVLIGKGAIVKARASSIHIKDNVSLGFDCRIASTSEVSIGSHCLFGARCYIGGAQHSFDRTDIPITRQPINSKGGVRIEDDVWLGVHVVVNDGIRIGKGAVVGAGSVVTRDLPPYAIAAGVPAKVIRKRKESNEKR
jgi:acetyltransferase-like isoleucine patch superfamily enzyme